MNGSTMKMLCCFLLILLQTTATFGEGLCDGKSQTFRIKLNGIGKLNTANGKDVLEFIKKQMQIKYPEVAFSADTKVYFGTLDDNIGKNDVTATPTSDGPESKATSGSFFSTSENDVTTTPFIEAEPTTITPTGEPTCEPAPNEPKNCTDFCCQNEKNETIFKNVGFSSKGAVATIYPEFAQCEGMKVFCDCSDWPTAAWLVFQRRVKEDLVLIWYWDDYARGFGDPEADFWLGLEALHNLTATTNRTLGVRYGKWATNYTQFAVGSSDENYRLHIAGNQSEDILRANGEDFSTYDRGIAQYSAKFLLTDWWFRKYDWGYSNQYWRGLAELKIKF